VRRLAREQLVQHAPQAVHVAPRVERALARRLLGAHVLGRAHHEPGLGEPFLVAPRGEGDAEVGHHRLALVQQDVLGLDVAVDQAVGVGVVQGGGHLPHQAHGLIDGKLRLGREPLPERAAPHVGHDVEQTPAGLAGVVERQDVGMVERRGDPDLADEPVGAEHGAQLGPEHLDGDLPAMAQVVGQINGRHASVPQLSENGVVVADYAGHSR
jgi:hypothetical protein